MNVTRLRVVYELSRRGRLPPHRDRAVSDDLQALRELERVPLGLPAGLELEWLGVAGYRLTYEGVSIFVDPYVSRVPLRALLLRRRRAARTRR